jgi:hypothetical protein
LMRHDMHIRHILQLECSTRHVVASSASLGWSQVGTPALRALKRCRYDRAELEEAVRAYDTGSNVSLPEIQKRCWAAQVRRCMLCLSQTFCSAQLRSCLCCAHVLAVLQGFFLPPPFAIAHHLVRAWCEKKQPWFATDTRTGPRSSNL